MRLRLHGAPTASRLRPGSCPPVSPPLSGGGGMGQAAGSVSAATEAALARLRGNEDAEDAEDAGFGGFGGCGAGMKQHSTANTLAHCGSSSIVSISTLIHYDYLSSLFFWGGANCRSGGWEHKTRANYGRLGGVPVCVFTCI